MIAWLASEALPYIIAAVSVLAAAAGVWLNGRSAGKATERAANEAQRVENIQEARHVENEIRAAGPAAARDRLRARQAARRK